MNEEIAAHVVEEVGKTYESDWMLVDQELIDRFADTTRDWTFVHVDPVKAAQTEFGGTIAHGFLLLSLLAPFAAETPRPKIPGYRVGLNYGFERIRFVSPVHSGRRIRARFAIASIEEVSPGRIREDIDVTLEVEDGDRPALAARWLTMYLM